jgi:hypothetical protein
MSTNKGFARLNAFSALTIGLLVLCLGAGTAILRSDFRLALLPLAFVFGWSQIGGV